MDQKKKGKYIGSIGALLVHIVVIVFLCWTVIARPQVEEESGVAVMLGMSSTGGGFSDPSLVEVETMPADVVADMMPAVEQKLITQAEEETVAIPAKTENESAPKPEKSEAERAEEARKQAEAKAETERRKAQEQANRRVAGAFGKGAQMGTKGSGKSEGVQGSPEGNSSVGATTGVGGYGEFDLGGRKIGTNGLPRPVYNVQDEGRVVVDIIVNPAGHVIATGINPQTNTINPALRKAAEDAAKKARFEVVEGLNNQSGTITYYFNLK